MKEGHKIFEQAINHLIGLIKKSDKSYFLRENDITCFLYRDLYNKLRRNNKYFTLYNGKKLFLLHTEHQYESLKPDIRYLGGEAIDLVVLHKNTNIQTAIEIKFSTKVTRNNKKQSAGEELLKKDITKLLKLKASYKYFLYYKEGGDCFITRESKEYKQGRDFLRLINNDKLKNNFKMFYIEKVEKHMTKKFYFYTIDKKSFKLIRLRSQTLHDPNKNFNIFIFSNSKWTFNKAFKEDNDKKTLKDIL